MNHAIHILVNHAIHIVLLSLCWFNVNIATVFTLSCNLCRDSHKLLFLVWVKIQTHIASMKSEEEEEENEEIWRNKLKFCGLYFFWSTYHVFAHSCLLPVFFACVHQPKMRVFIDSSADRVVQMRDQIFPYDLLKYATRNHVLGERARSAQKKIQRIIRKKKNTFLLAQHKVAGVDIYPI